MADSSLPDPVPVPAETPAPRTTHRRPLVSLLAIAGVMAAVVWGVNFVRIARPIAEQLNADERNSGFTLAAHYDKYVIPFALVLDLRRVDSAAPADLLRGLFQAAEVMHTDGRSFERVYLCRSGNQVFQMSGEAFAELGAAVAGGENPIYLIRTLPEKLYRPSGEAAFGTWTGGLFGVLGKQMEDVNEAAAAWARGS